MSTGLTYVTIVDTNDVDPQGGMSSLVFSDYNEAMKYGAYIIKMVYQIIITPGANINVIVYTTSPNVSGRWLYLSGAPYFQAVDV